jgi:hypothetical protein
LNPKRFWDGDAVRETADLYSKRPNTDSGGIKGTTRAGPLGPYQPDGTRPLYDHWLIAPQGYPGAHYAVWTPEIARRLILTMCPARVCRECGEPSRRIVDSSFTARINNGKRNADRGDQGATTEWHSERSTVGWSDCGHDAWRPGNILDPFGGSGTTAAVAAKLERDCTLIDINADNARLMHGRLRQLAHVENHTETSTAHTWDTFPAASVPQSLFGP